MIALQDIRHALRVLRRTPALTAIALLSIAISVGATAIVFTAIKAVLIEPLPYSKAAELVQIRTEYAKFGRSHADWVSWSDMQDVVRSTHTLESLGTYHYAILNLSGDQSLPPEALYGLGVSASLFPTLGVTPMLGRNFLPEEDQPGRDRELILSHDLWQRRFNSDPGIVGRSVQIDGHDHLIVGVMPPRFDFPMRLATTVRTPYSHMQFWEPLGLDPAKAVRAATGFGAVARLRHGVSQAQAEQDLNAIGATLERQYRVSNEGRSLHLAELGAQTLGTARIGLLLLMGAAAMFMLIGCSNVANLLLARALARHREIAVRLALGAGRARIIRQLMTESCVLAIAGALGAYALTVLAWSLLPAIAPMTIPRLAAARPDWMVFAFTLAVSLLNGILFGIAPALRTAARDPAIALAESAARGSTGGSRNRLRSALVVAEVAVAVILVVIGGILTGSFVRLFRTDPGFQADRVLASIIVPTGERYKTPESRGVLFRRVLDSVRVLPGVESVGAVDALPFSGENTGGLIRTSDSDADQIAEVDVVTAGYLQTMGVPLLQGRWFREEETTGSHNAAIVNDIAANRLWPGESALGKRICLNCTDNAPKQWKEVVGVVQTIHHAALDDKPGAEIYLAGGAFQSAQFLVVRTRRPSADLVMAIRRAVAAIDPNQPVFLSATMSSLIADSVADRRFIMTLLAITACLALALAAAGVYGVVSYVTSRRTQEIGIRMALGAAPRHVHALIFRQGMTMAAVGVVVGLAGAMALMRVLHGALAGLTASDPLLICSAVMLVTLAAATACWIPARRATRIDPMAALR